MFDFFQHIYCINLPNRTDRRDIVYKEFERLGIQKRVEFIEGLIGEGFTNIERGEKGCTLSHIKCLQDAKEKGYKNILIFEDDVCFSSNFQKKIEDSISELPINWDLFYLGFSPHEKDSSFENYSNNLHKLNKLCLTSHAIAYSNNIILEILNKPQYFVHERAYDRLLSKYIQTKHLCFATNPPIALQNSTFSSISPKRYLNYNFYINSYNSKSNNKIIL